MLNKTIGQTVEYNVYMDGGTSLGVASVELPELESMTETIKGAGLGGEVEMPTVGLMKPMKAKLTFNRKTSNYVKLLAPRGRQLDCRICVQGLQEQTGLFAQMPEKITMRTLPKKATLGKIEAGKPQENEVELEVIYLKLTISGKEALEFDKFNYIYKVDGMDYMQPVRAGLGMEA